MSKIFIGIDVSKDSFNFSVIDEKLAEIQAAALPMNSDGFQNFKKILVNFPNSIVAMESTGSYHTNLLSFLLSFKKEICLVNPVLIKQFSKTITLRKTKTDEIDANIIAKFILKNFEHISYFSLSNFDEIKTLARIREDISKNIAVSKTRLKQHLNLVFPELLFEVNVFTDTMLAILENFPTPKSILSAKNSAVQKIIESFKGRAAKISVEILKNLAKSSIGNSSETFAKIISHDVKTLIFFNQELDDITENFIDKVNQSKKDDLEILKSIKGIGDLTACHFLAEIRDIKNFSTKNKLIAFAGTDPSVKQSGTSLHSNGRISKKGSKSLRRYLYLMASGVMKFNDYFRAYYDKKRGEGFQHRKAMIALVNKLLRTIFALLSKKELFVEPTYL